MPTPDDILLGQVDRVLASRKSVTQFRFIHTKIQTDSIGPVQKAAKMRGMTVASYARRAIIAFAAFDTGEDFLKMLDNEPGIRPRTSSPTGIVSERGEGHGNWGIVELR